MTTEGTDLNNYTTRGTYYFSTSYTPTNIPNGLVNGWLQVFTNLSSGGPVKQIFYRQGTANTNDFQTYVRTYTSSTWSDWALMLTTASSSVTSGTLTYSTTYCNSGSATYRQWGRIVTFHCNPTVNFSLIPTDNAYYTIGTGLPAPIAAYYPQGAVMASGYNGACLFRVTTSGEVQINRYVYSGTGTSIYVQISGTYITAS